MSTLARDATGRDELERQMPHLKWTPAMFRLASRAGCFEDKRVELIGGRIVAMTDDPPHMKRTILCERMLQALLPETDWFVAREICLNLPRWTPRTDVVVCRGPLVPTYDERLPTAADTVLVVEVSDTTYLKDRLKKLPRYARASIPVCWIINIPRARIEVYSRPDGGRYQRREDYNEGQEVPVTIDGREVGTIPVRSILGNPTP
jgi:Uma2 family endonuclease